MLIKSSSILFTTLFLFGCASYSLNKTITNEKNESDYSIKKNSNVEDKNVNLFTKCQDNKNINLYKKLKKINTQKEVINVLGEPLEKTISIFTWNPRHKPYYEYVENWKWEKPILINILFNREGKIHDKIQQTIIPNSYDEKLLKSLKELSPEWLNNWK